MKVLVTGVKGQLGYDVVKELKIRGVECKGVDIEDFDLTDRDAVISYIKGYGADAVVHCAAYTAVDKAEEMKDLCFKVNVEGTENVAIACKETDAKMIYISTDYVFEGKGDKAFETDDEKKPQNVYGVSKYQGELKVKEILSKYFIVRISWVFGINGGNFIKTMLRLSETRDSLSVVCDQIGSPTYTLDLAKLLCDMLETEKYGEYHATNEGYCSWYEFANAIFSKAGKKINVSKVETKDYKTAASRPLNSRMSKKSLDDNGFKRLPSWEDALNRYLLELKGE